MNRLGIAILALVISIGFMVVSGCGNQNPPVPVGTPSISSDYKAYPIGERPYKSFQDGKLDLPSFEVDAFVDAFPFEKYKIYEVKNLGKFFLDDINDYIKNTLKTGNVWESKHVEYMKQFVRPGSTFVDVGTHIGTITIPASRIVGPSGKVISFEPQPKIFRELNHNLMLNNIRNVHTYRLAIGDEAGEIELKPFVPGNEGGTSLDSNLEGTGEKANVIKLDSMNLNNVSVIKIDVEGWEDKVLNGARETILRNKPVILIEIMGGHDYDNTTAEIRSRVDQTKSILAGLGYVVERFPLNVSVYDYIAKPSEK